jgi:hypothetical protein
MHHAVKQPTPGNIQQAVKTAVLGIVILDAAMVAILQGAPISIFVAILLIPAIKLGKWLYAT